MASTFYSSKGLVERHPTLKKKGKSGKSFIGTQMAVSPVSPAMTPMGTAQSAARELLGSVLDSIVQILGELSTEFYQLFLCTFTFYY